MVTESPGMPRLSENAEPVFFWQLAQWQTATSAGASWQELFASGYRMVVGPHDVILLREAARAALRDYQSFRGTGGVRPGEATSCRTSTSGLSY